MRVCAPLPVERQFFPSPSREAVAHANVLERPGLTSCRGRFHSLKRTAGARSLVPGERKERQDFNAAQLKRLCEVYDMDPTQVSVSLTLRVRLYSRVRLRLRVRLRARVCRGVCWGGVVAMQLLSCRRVHGLGFGVYAVCVASVQLCWCPCVVTGVCFAWCTQRPDREIVAKEIDKLEGGRPVTQYDVLAWMQTRKRMIKKKEERNALNKDPDALRSGVNMHAMPPQPQVEVFLSACV